MIEGNDLNKYQAKRQLQFNEWIENQRHYVILDTETTGICNAEICDIAIIDLKGNTLYNSLVKPQSGIPEDAIHGITNEMVKNKPNWIDVWNRIYPVLKDKTILIYNDEFDMRVMKDSFHPYQISDEIKKQINQLKSECVMRSYADYINSNRWVKLSYACGYQTDHRALSDCLATLDVIKKCYNPTFTEVDYERIRIRDDYLENEETIKNNIDTIKLISEELNRLIEKQSNLHKKLMMTDGELQAKLDAEKAVAVADITDEDLPF